MKVIVKETFTKAEEESGALLVTPYSFGRVKSWKGYDVSGLEYYVNKAIGLGAKKPKPKPKKEK